MTWDSYRAEDGRWIVTAFHDGGSVGTWVYEVVGRSVHPADASARALMGAGPTEVSSEPTVDSDAAEEATTQPESTDDRSPEPEPEGVSRPRLVSITSDPTVDRTRDDSAAAVDEPELKPADSADADDSGQQALISESPAPRRTKRTKGKKGRASVPSWDEILFGATKDSE